MYTGLIANRYARSLFDFALSKGEEKGVYIQVKELILVFHKKKQLEKSFISPITTEQIKLSAIGDMISEPLCPSLKSFISLVVRHRREKYFYFMLHSFVKIYKEKKHITTVVLTTAVPVSEEKAALLVSSVAKRTGSKEIEILQKVNPDIIGGFIIRVNDLLINASIARQLSILKQRYEK